MKNNCKIIAVLALVCVLMTSVFAGSAFAESQKDIKTNKTPQVKPFMRIDQKDMMNRLLSAKIGKTGQAKAAEQTEQKDLLVRLLEKGILTEKSIEDIKNYLQANPIVPDDSKKAKNIADDHAVLNKLSSLTMDQKLKKRMTESLTDLIKKLRKEAAKDAEPIEEKLTLSALNAMIKASVITEEQGAAIVLQMTQDLLDAAVKNKSLSQEDYDALQTALKEDGEKTNG